MCWDCNDFTSYANAKLWHMKATQWVVNLLTSTKLHREQNCTREQTDTRVQTVQINVDLVKFVNGKSHCA